MFVLKCKFKWHNDLGGGYKVPIKTIWSSGGILLLNFGQIW